MGEGYFVFHKNIRGVGYPSQGELSTRYKLTGEPGEEMMAKLQSTIRAFGEISYLQEPIFDGFEYVRRNCSLQRFILIGRSCFRFLKTVIQSRQ